MSAEMRIVRAPVAWGALAGIAVSMIVYLVRDARAARSVLVAAGLIVGNAALAATMSALAARFVSNGAAFVAFPSFAVRMMLIFTTLSYLRTQPFIDPSVFAITFVAALTFVLWGEARAWARTPWLVLTFSPAPTRREDP